MKKLKFVKLPTPMHDKEGQKRDSLPFIKQSNSNLRQTYIITTIIE
jgi:hypothetical protein